MIISIEGNIGSGKSTFFNYIKEQLDQTNIIFLCEPVDIWESIKDKDGNLLEHFYNDPYKYSFCFQMTAYISRLIMLKDAIKSLEPGGTIITERCVFSDFNVFAKMLYNSGKINSIEIECYKKWFNYFIGDIPQINFIYLKTDPEICYERIISRGRNCEKDITMEYIRECENYHNNWLLDSRLSCLSRPTNLTILNGGVNKFIIYKYLNIIKKLIHNPELRVNKRKISSLQDTLSNFTLD